MFGIHLTNKRCRTNAVNFCFPSHCIRKDIIYSLTHSLPCVFLFIFAFHLINLDGLFVYGMLPIRLNPFVCIEMESVKVDSSFICYAPVWWPVLCVSCCVEHQTIVDLLWFDQIAAVLQIALWLLSFSSKILYFRSTIFHFPKRASPTKPECNRLQYTFRLKSARAKKHTKREMNWIEYEKHEITIEKSNNILVGERKNQTTITKKDVALHSANTHMDYISYLYIERRTLSTKLTKVFSQFLYLCFFFSSKRLVFFELIDIMCNRMCRRPYVC